MVCCDFHWAATHVNVGTVILSVVTALAPSTDTDLMYFCFRCPNWNDLQGVIFSEQKYFEKSGKTNKQTAQPCKCVMLV